MSTMTLVQAVEVMRAGKMVCCDESPEVKYYYMADGGIIWRVMHRGIPPRKTGLLVFTAHEALNACWRMYVEDET